MRNQAQQAAATADLIRIDEAREKQEEAKAKAAEHPRLTLKSMGLFFRLVEGNSVTAFFTNVSDRAGFLCTAAVATNAKGETTRSMPACLEVAAYASNVTSKMLFAGNEFARVCPQGDCAVTIRDAE